MCSACSVFVIAQYLAYGSFAGGTTRNTSHTR
jgi:hypothetical protein